MTDTVRVPRADPDTIWLEPSCCADPIHGRQWCEDNAFPVCENGCKPVKYIRADLAASPQGEGDWIKHDGGPNPVPGKMVEVKFRSGKTQERLSDHYLDCWGQRPPTMADIIAYRVTEGVKP